MNLEAICDMLLRQSGIAAIILAPVDIPGFDTCSSKDFIAIFYFVELQEFPPKQSFSTKTTKHIILIQNQ